MLHLRPIDYHNIFILVFLGVIFIAWISRVRTMTDDQERKILPLIAEGVFMTSIAAPIAGCDLKSRATWIREILHAHPAASSSRCGCDEPSSRAGTQSQHAVWPPRANRKLAAELERLTNDIATERDAWAKIAPSSSSSCKRLEAPQARAPMMKSQSAKR